MKAKRFFIEGKHGVPLHCLTVFPEGEVKAVVVILHGIAEHKERYLDYMKWMAAEGYAMFAYDHRKHGKSLREDEKLGIFSADDKWEYVIDDVHYVVKDARKKMPGRDIIILGHSMGSIIARRYAAKYSQVPKAVVLVGTLPILNRSETFGPLFMARVCNIIRKNSPSTLIAKAINKPMLASYEEPRTPLDWLSKDEKVIDKYLEDPLSGFAYNARFYIEFFKSVRKVNKTENISDTRNIPILFIAGKDDPIGEFGVGVEDVYKLYMGHGFFEVRLKLIPDNRHEILNEPEKLETYKIIAEWLQSSLEN